MSIFDCADTTNVVGKPDQEIIALGQKIDRILEEIKLFTQEAMSKFISTIEKSVAYQESILNNSLQYIRSIVDIQTQNISSVLTVNRESISNLVSSILTELIIQLNVNGLPVGTEIELSRPIIVENQVNNYGQVSNYNLESNQSAGGFTGVPASTVGGYGNNGQQIGITVRPDANGPGNNGNRSEIPGEQSDRNGQTAQNRDSSGQSQNFVRSIEAVSSSSKEVCKDGSQVVVLINGSQFYGSVLGTLQNTLNPVISITGPVTDVNVLNETNDLLNQVPAPVVPPPVQSPVGSLLPAGVSNPVDIKQPEAFRFQQRNQPWFRDSVAWSGQDLIDFYNSQTQDDYLKQGTELRNKRNL